MFIRRSTYRTLIARAETYRQAELNARRTVTTLVGNSARAAEEFIDADDRTNAVERRLDRELKACARYRAALPKSEKQARDLQARLDDLLGLNAPGIVAGALWQERRTDKPKQVAP